MGCAIQFLCYFRFTFVDDLGFITQSGLPAGPKHFNNNHIFVDFCNFALLAARRPDPARKGGQGLAIGLRRSCARLGKTPNAWQKACVAASARVGTLSQNGYGALPQHQAGCPFEASAMHAREKGPERSREDRRPRLERPSRKVWHDRRPCWGRPLTINFLADFRQFFFYFSCVFPWIAFAGLIFPSPFHRFFRSPGLRRQQGCCVCRTKGCLCGGQRACAHGEVRAVVCAEQRAVSVGDKKACVLEFGALLRVRGPEFLGQFGGTYLQLGGETV